MFIIFYTVSFSAKNVPQKVEPQMALVPVDLVSAVFVRNKLLYFSNYLIRTYWAKSTAFLTGILTRIIKEFLKKIK